MTQAHRFQRPFQQRVDDDRASKFFAIDWSDVLRRLAVWDELRPESREWLSQLKVNDPVPAHALGSDLALLETGDILQVTVNRVTARMSESAQPFFRLLRAIGRHNLLARHDRQAFLDYLRDHFTTEERHNFARSLGGWGSESQIARTVISVSWPRSVAVDRTAFALPAHASLGDARTLVRWFLDNPEFVPLGELPQRVTGLAPVALASGLRLCLEQMLLFPAFRYPDRTVVVGLWPTVAKRLSEPVPVPPVAFDAERQYEGAWLLDDMTVVLVNASTEPLRLRRDDGALFERTAAALSAQLVPPPDWLMHEKSFRANARVLRAREQLEELKLLVESRGKLRPGRLASAWLSLDETARLRSILDWLREQGIDDDRNGDYDDDDDNDDADDDDDDESDDRDSDDVGWKHESHFVTLDNAFGYALPVARRPRLLMRSTAQWWPPRMQQLALAGVQRALAGLAESGFTPMREFELYHSRCVNPLLAGDDEVNRGLRHLVDEGAGVDEELEALWANLLRDVCFGRLIPLGCAAIGMLGEQTGFRMTTAGRYLLGLVDEFDDRARDDGGAGAVIVQPNFEVVFMSPVPRAEAAIASFAERAGNRVGVLFRLTRSSVFAAAAAGVTAEHAVAVLTEFASRPVPDNVIREINGWFGACRRIDLAPALLLRCPDAGTAARILAAGGKAVRPVSDTVLELVNANARNSVIRTLRGLGIFVNEGTRRAHRNR